MIERIYTLKTNIRILQQKANENLLVGFFVFYMKGGFYLMYKKLNFTLGVETIAFAVNEINNVTRGGLDIYPVYKKRKCKHQ